MGATVTSTAAEGGGDPALRVFRVSTSQLVVGPVRLVLGCGLLGLAIVLGAAGPAAGVAFGVGVFGLAFAALDDPRRRFVAQRGEPEPLPGGAAIERWHELAAHAIFPSTVGVSALTGIALGLGQQVLAALLAGALAGMGAAALVSAAALLLHERELGAQILVERRTRRLYERPLR
ncbi:MAG TPA: hypothetical protein VFI37_11745 [Gaiellaceae bacterium]|nr:hypothetical protein [Gaiellaceae bacterium]